MAKIFCRGYATTLVLWLVLLWSAMGKEPLSAELLPASARVRQGAPQNVLVKLTRNAPTLLEGRLEFLVGEPSSPEYRYVSQELALSQGTRTLQMMMPAVLGHYGGDTTQVRLQFLTASGPIPLGTHSLGKPDFTQIQLMLGVSATSSRRERPQLWTAIRLQIAAPSPADNSGQARLPIPAVTTTPVFLDAEDFPTDPLALCALDGLLLEADIFQQLRPKQLSALQVWIEAGGSLWLATDGSPGANSFPERQAFLRELGVTEGPNPQLLRAGFGRVVVSPQTDALPQNKKAIEFFWKQRTEQVVAEDQGESLSGQISGVLIPDSIQLIPRSTLLLILGCFLLAIGPLDYFVLGKLRRRHWTWVLFPTLALAFTGFTLWLAQSTLGSQNHLTSILITDITASGKVVRETRLDLHFWSRPGEVTTQGQRALAVPAAHIDNYYGRGGDYTPTANVPVYEGQFPGQYTLRQSLQQWTPQLNRSTSFPSSPDTSGIPWEKLADSQFSNAWSQSADGADVYKLSAPNYSNTIQQFSRAQNSEILRPDLISQLCWRKSKGAFWHFDQIAPTGDSDLGDLAPLSASGPALLVVVRREGSLIHIYRRLLTQ